MEIRGSSMQWRVCRAAPRRATPVNVGSRLAQKLPRYLLPLRFSSRLPVSRPLSSLFAAARFYNSTHRRYLRQGVDSPLVVDLPTRGDASLAHRSRPACSKTRLSLGSPLQDIHSVCARVCVYEPRSYPGSPIGPRGASSVSDWTGIGSISAHPRVCASTTIIVPRRVRCRCYPKWWLSMPMLRV